MFSGLFGEDLFLRLDEAEQGRVMKSGGRNFEVMPGRAMKGYVVAPSDWRRKGASSRALVASALAFTLSLPAKEKEKGKKAAARPAGRSSR
jgi:hypothetical protein